MHQNLLLTPQDCMKKPKFAVRLSIYFLSQNPLPTLSTSAAIAPQKPPCQTPWYSWGSRPPCWSPPGRPNISIKNLGIDQPSLQTSTKSPCGVLMMQTLATGRCHINDSVVTSCCEAFHNGHEGAQKTKDMAKNSATCTKHPYIITSSNKKLLVTSASLVVTSG